jgi:hypothetical protein
MEADTMSRPETCRIVATPVDCRRYGIAKGEIAAGEDGFRTRPGGPGTFEPTWSVRRMPRMLTTWKSAPARHMGA